MSVNMKQNDRLPVLQATLNGHDGNPLDLTTASGVVFRMRSRVTGVVKVNAAAAVTDAANGVVQYSWAAGDTDTPGVYDGEFRVTIGGLVETVPSSGFVLVMIEPGVV